MIHLALSAANVLFFILLFLFIRFKEYRHFSFIFYVPLVIVFFVPVNYVYFGGKSYVQFGQLSYLFFVYSFILTLISSYLFLLVRIAFRSSKRRCALRSIKWSGCALADILLIWLLLVSLSVLFYYWNDWPFVNALSGVVVDRPDIVHGEFESYFLISVIFQVVMPCVYFHFYSILSKRLISNTLCFSLVCLFLVVGGNKAVLFFFFVFCVLFLFRNFSIFRVVFLLSLSFSVYLLMKGGLSSYNSIYLATESAIRRLFVTQGMGIPNALEIYSQGVDFSVITSNELKALVFEYVYGYQPGSMPVFYIVEAYLRWGALALMIASILPPVVLGISSVVVDRLGSISVGWVYYYFTYAFLMSGFSTSNGYRLLFCLLFVVVYCCFKSIRLKLSSRESTYVKSELHA